MKKLWNSYFQTCFVFYLFFFTNFFFGWAIWEQLAPLINKAPLSWRKSNNEHTLNFSKQYNKLKNKITITITIIIIYLHLFTSNSDKFYQSPFFVITWSDNSCFCPIKFVIHMNNTNLLRFFRPKIAFRRMACCEIDDPCFICFKSISITLSTIVMANDRVLACL